MLEKPKNVLYADKRKRVLICEDDTDVAALLRMTLEHEGLVTDIAYDAAQAKDFLAQFEYSAMTLDLMLPDQHGISLLHELRSAKETAKLPIIVVSAYVQEGKKELHGQAYSVIDWIDKPIDHYRLETAMKQAITNASDNRARVLYVEDDPDMYGIVHAIVGESADIENAATLADARKMLKSKQFDMVILDITLPDGSGLELLDELNNATPPVRVMVFSANEPPPESARLVEASLAKSSTDNSQLQTTIKRMVGIE